MIISKNEIYIVLNNQALNGRDKIEFFYPFLNIKLFELNMKDGTISNIITRHDFDSTRRRYAKSEFLRKELPSHHDLLDIFLSSGILKFENQEEIDENFELLRKSVDDRTIYVKPLFIGIDTNIAYYRIVSRRIKKQFKYVISDIVVEEIDARIHSKYNSKMVWELEKLPYKTVAGEFANASTKDARKAKNAMNEIYYITNGLDAFRINGTTETKDKEIRDREIVKQYRRFSNEINVEVVMLTADKDMVFHAQAEQLSSIYFKLPHALKSQYNVDLETIPNIIYDLAIVFGAVKLNATLILGVWRGKTSEDYFNEKLKVYNPEVDMIKDLEICRGVLNELQRDES